MENKWLDYQDSIYRVSLNTLIDVKNNETSPWERRHVAVYDCGNEGRGNLTQVQQQHINEQDVAITDLEYNRLGNFQEVQGPANNNQHLTLSFDYDEATHTYPVNINNQSYGYTSQAHYDLRWGKNLLNSVPIFNLLFVYRSILPINS